MGDNIEMIGIGDRVRLYIKLIESDGTVAFIGPTSFAKDIWAGVILDDTKGKNDGEVAGVRYFSCLPMHGLFLRPIALHKINVNGDFLRASVYGSTEKIATILRQGGGKIDVNMVDSNGRTPLYWASFNGFFEIVTLLLQHGINVSKRDKYGHTPLYAALRSGHEKIVELLLDRGAVVSDIQHADIDINRSIGLTLLQKALGKSHIASLNLLLRHPDIDVNKSDEDGDTPLLLASQRGHIVILNSLLQHTDIDVNKPNERGVTPLMMAAVCDIECVHSLLNGGANPHSRSLPHGGGVTPRKAAACFLSSDAYNSVFNAIDRWPVTMTILCFKELAFFHWVDLSMIDLWEFIGQEEDFIDKFQFADF